MDKEAVAARVKLSREAILKLLLFAAIAWLVFGLISFFLPPLLRWNFPTLAASIEPGTFGDMFGAGNAFFSALAFGAVAYTLWLQTQELEEARAERHEAREDSKENIKLQGEIAESQRAAAEMQFKVAQSGDVFAAYSRVADSMFVDRLQRLKWITGSTNTIKNSPEWLKSCFAREKLKMIERAEQRDVPHRYRVTNIPQSEAMRAGGTDDAIADRVLQDVRECVSAVVGLRAALKLGLLGGEQISEVLLPWDCEFIAMCARATDPEFEHQAVLLEEICDHVNRALTHPSSE